MKNFSDTELILAGLAVLTLIIAISRNSPPVYPVAMPPSVVVVQQPPEQPQGALWIVLILILSFVAFSDTLCSGKQVKQQQDRYFPFKKG
jgi:hypothetical protein